MRFSVVILVFVLFFSMIGCQNDAIYEEFKPLSINGWDLHDTLDFQFEIKDISKKYNLYINVRHRDLFEYQNFYIKTFTQFPSGRIKEDILSIPLSNEAGEWIGKCTGDVCFYRAPIISRFKFEEPGTYHIRLKHEMRVNDLENMIDVGLKLEEAPKLKIEKEEI
jgi:gliding motility-associated lipoprotein GldH